MPFLVGWRRVKKKVFELYVTEREEIAQWEK
jgi:hypothetical protein